jgi:hypothetical protein
VAAAVVTGTEDRPSAGSGLAVISIFSSPARFIRAWWKNIRAMLKVKVYYTIL